MRYRSSKGRWKNINNNEEEEVKLGRILIEEEKKTTEKIQLRR